MSDAFVKLMSQGGKSSPSTSGGRPMHDQWFGFKKVDNNGRIAAKCIKCSKSFVQYFCEFIFTVCTSKFSVKSAVTTTLKKMKMPIISKVLMVLQLSTIWMLTQ